jgi:hypothetical protein
MADKRISELTLHTSPQLSDVIAIVNNSETKKIAYGSLYYGIREGVISGSSQIVLGDVTNFTSYSSSVESKLENLISATSSYLTSETDSQTLTIVGDQLTISDGNTVTIPIGSGSSIDTGSFFIDVSPGGPFIQFTLGDGTSRVVEVDNVNSSSYATNSTFASLINITSDNSTNATRYITFVDTTSGFNNVKVDSGITYNPSTNTLTASTIVGNLTGTASNSVITGSLSDGTLTFTKGDSSTFDINLEAVFTKHAWISTYSTSSQALVSSGSAQPVTFTSIWTQEGVSLVSGSQITFAEAGTYEFNFVAQVKNTDNAVHESYFWVKYNGNNFPNSTTSITLPTRKDSGDASSQLMTMSIIGVAQNNNDYIELYWTGDSTTLSLAQTPAFNGVPETPSIIASIKRIG